MMASVLPLLSRETMRIFILAFLMLILPAQASLAAMENAHGHTFTIEPHHHTAALNEQADHHDAQHTEHAQSLSHCDQGHHHCHASNLGVLPNVTTLQVNLGACHQASDTKTQFQSFLDHRIERPKWA